MHYKELCGKPYLSAEDLEEGRDYEVEIEDVFIEKAFNPGPKKEVEVGVLKFKGRTLKMIVKTTNARTIMSMFGTETDNWIGHRIRLFRTTTALKGKMVPCIRIKGDTNVKNKN